jgi:hypothetical protein
VLVVVVVVVVVVVAAVVMVVVVVVVVVAVVAVVVAMVVAAAVIEVVEAVAVMSVVAVAVVVMLVVVVITVVVVVVVMVVAVVAAAVVIVAAAVVVVLVVVVVVVVAAVAAIFINVPNYIFSLLYSLVCSAGSSSEVTSAIIDITDGRRTSWLEKWSIAKLLRTKGNVNTEQRQTTCIPRVGFQLATEVFQRQHERQEVQCCFCSLSGIMAATAGWNSHKQRYTFTGGERPKFEQTLIN